MAAFDPRLTPARADLAAKHLEGEVPAARYVEGRVVEVVAPGARLRGEPRPDAPLDTEALRGERVTVYDTNEEGWSWGQLAADGYVGWLPRAALAPPGPAPTHKVVTLRTLVFPGPSIKLPPLEALPLGATLTVTRVQERLAITPAGAYLPAAHLAPLDAYEPAFVAVAERFVRLRHRLPARQRHAGGGAGCARRRGGFFKPAARRPRVLERPRRHRA